MVDLIFYSLVRLYSGCLTNPAMLEHGAAEDHVVKCINVSQHLAILINVAKSLSAHELFVPAVV